MAKYRHSQRGASFLRSRRFSETHHTCPFEVRSTRWKLDCSFRVYSNCLVYEIMPSYFSEVGVSPRCTLWGSQLGPRGQLTFRRSTKWTKFVETLEQVASAILSDINSTISCPFCKRLANRKCEEEKKKSNSRKGGCLAFLPITAKVKEEKSRRGAFPVWNVNDTKMVPRWG